MVLFLSDRHTPHATVRGAVLIALMGCGSAGGSPEVTAGGPNANVQGVQFGAQGEVTREGTGFDSSLACAAQEASTEHAPVSVQLVVDTSGSMNDRAPGSRRSKWTETRDALLTAIDSMPDTTVLGALFYPDVPNNSDPCLDKNVDVDLAALGAPGSAQRRAVSQAFRSQNPQGGTPTHDAYRFALEASQDDAVPGGHTMLLITDGQATFSLGCVGSGNNNEVVDTTPLIEDAAQALTRGVKTYVVGSPGSEDARESLSRLAEAGGTARPNCSHDGPQYCHFDMTQGTDFATSLRDALAEITGLALSCNYVLPAPGDGTELDPDKVNVVFQPEGGALEVLQRSATGRNCSSGWQYSRDGQQVVLCGESCTRVRNSNGSLKLEFGCLSQGVF
jgi:hypothetical protein